LAKAVGIDIGSHAVKVAVVDGTPKGAKLLRYVEVAHDSGGAPSPDATIAALKRALGEGKAPRQSASHAYPAEQCILREISVPFENDDQIAKVVKFEFEPHLHQGAIEDVVLDYIRTGKARAGSRILCIAAQKGAVKERLGVLGRAGVDPLHLDVDVAALFNAARQCGALDEHPNCLILDIGSRTTKALAVRDGELRVARSIRLGTGGAERSVESQLEGDRDAARKAMETAAGVESLAAPSEDGPVTTNIVRSVQEIEAAVARAVQDDFLSRVLRETQRTLPTTGEDRPLTRVFLTGGGARHPNARERIASHFGVEVSDLPVLAHLEHRLAPSEARIATTFGAVAVGTALKVVGIDHGGIDLRQEEFRFSRTFDRVKTGLAVAATLVFFAVFLTFLQGLLEKKRTDAEAARLQKTLADSLEEDVFKQYAAAVPQPRQRHGSATDAPTVYFRNVREDVRAIRNHLKNELGLATEVPPIRSGLEPWAAVAAGLKLARDKYKVEYLLLKEERYYQDKCDITVICGELSDPDSKVAEAFRQNKELFDSIEVGSPKTTKDGKYEVTLKIRFTEPEAGADVRTTATGDGK